MEDKAIRPERRPIKPQEIQKHLNQVTEHLDPEPESVSSKPFQLPAGAVKGNVPEFLQRMEATEMPVSAPIQNLPTQGEMYARSVGAKIDTRVQEVIQKIRQTTTNYEEIQLPSLGRFYDGSNVPANGKLHIRPMTGHEEEILATQRFVKKGQAVNMIFSRCLQENINVDKLLVIDRTHLLIYLRGISYTQNYDVELKCPECDHKFEETIDLDTLPVNVCPEDYTPNSLKGELPTTGLAFAYRIPTGEDERHVQDYREQKIRFNKNFDASEQSDVSSLYRIALLIDDISGISKNDEVLQILQSLPMNDVAHLRNLINFPPFGVDTNIPIHCPNCSVEFDVDLPIGSNFFFPRSKPKMKEENQ